MPKKSAKKAPRKSGGKGGPLRPPAPTRNRGERSEASRRYQMEDIEKLVKI